MVCILTIWERTYFSLKSLEELQLLEKTKTIFQLSEEKPEQQIFKIVKKIHF